MMAIGQVAKNFTSKILLGIKPILSHNPLPLKDYGECEVVTFVSWIGQYIVLGDWIVQTLDDALVGRCSEQEESNSDLWIPVGTFFYVLFCIKVVLGALTLLAATKYFCRNPENPSKKFSPPSLSFNFFFNSSGVNE